MDAETIVTALDVLWDRKYALLQKIAALGDAPADDDHARGLVQQLSELHLAIKAAGAALQDAKARGLHDGRYVNEPTDSDRAPTDNDG